MAAITSFFRPLGARSGVQLVAGKASIGTGGVAAVASSTASAHVSAPFRKCKLVGLSVIAKTAGAGGGAMTVQAFRRNNTGTPADVTVAATFDLTATNITTTDKAYTWAITATDSQTIFQKGDTLRIDVVCASTISTQPQVVVCAEWAVLA